MPSFVAKSFYFTEFSFAKGLFYFAIMSYMLTVAILVMIEPLINTQACEENFTVEFGNPAYNENPCRHMRMSKLLFLTPDECSFGRRLLMSIIFGSIIGWERREADRPAGIRTMSLVSLGSCLFTIDGTFAFLNGPMTWDASRISAAIPSGVGFLGAGLIFKENEKDKLTGEGTHVVHGLTTAASVWLSAAVGVACGGELYFAAAFGIAITLCMLRFGPRQKDADEDDSFDAFGDIEVGYAAMQSVEIADSVDGGSDKRKSFADLKQKSVADLVRLSMRGEELNDEQTALLKSTIKERKSVVKKKARLSGAV